MRILHVIANMNPEMGGVCQAVRTMVCSLNDAGINNEVLSLDRSDASFLSTESFPIHALGKGKGIWGYSPSFIPWLKSNINRFDSIIVHGLWQYHSYAVKKAIKDLHKKADPSSANIIHFPKLFIMPHGMLDPYFQRAKGRRLKAIRNWLYWKLIEGDVINEADGVLFTCEEEKKLAREPFKPYHPKKEFVVGLGVEPPPSFANSMKEAFVKKCPQINNDNYIIFLSRIHEKKGVDLLIEAYKKILFGLNSHERFPKLVIAGPGMETAYGKKILALVSQTDRLRDFIFFPGMLREESKWGAFYGCDAFILPSHQENFGIAVVEALACGKAVLISKQVNIFKEIEANSGGLVKEDTIEGTFELLKCWKEMDFEKKECMARKARMIYENKFAVKTVSKNLIEVLTE